MDAADLEPATQPYGDAVQSMGIPVAEDAEDVADIIVFLYPGSPEAIELVQQCKDTAPQHVTLNASGYQSQQAVLAKHASQLRPPDEGYAGPTQQTQFTQSAKSFGEPDALVLRFSSRLKDITMGFRFGRNESKCDIVIKPNYPPVKVSNLHFRIFLNESGILMIADTSTNGTFVDKLCLTSHGSKTRSQCVLEHGMRIEVITCTDAATAASKRVTFFVVIPNRSSDEIRSLYQQNVTQFLAERAKVANKHQINGTKNAMPPPRDGLIGIGSARYTHGMRWDGGEKYTIIDQIGKGTFAIVYKIASRAHGEVFAAKEISKSRVPNGGNLNQKIENEIQIMKKVTHPHVLSLLDSHDSGSHLYLILEYMPGGELSQYLHERERMPENLAQSITRQLCQALGYIHSQGITHRDVKPENVLIQSHDPMWVKLSDFGLSKMIEDQGLHVLATFCGTLLYCAPEVYPDYEERMGLERYNKNSVLPRAKYNSKVDIWSLAAVIFHLLAKVPAYQPGSARDRADPDPSPPQATSKLMFDSIMSPDLVNWRTVTAMGYSSSALHFLQSMLKISPQARPSASECLAHPWLRDIVDVADDLPTNEVFIEPDSFGAWEYSDRFLLDQANMYTARESPSGSDEQEQPPIHLNGNGLAARPKLFGEVKEMGRADSDILGVAPVAGLDGDDSDSSGVPVPADESAMHSTVSQIEELTVDSPGFHGRSVSYPSSFLKRARDEIEQAEAQRGSVKRLMSFSSAARTSPRPILGRLVPVPGSMIGATTLELSDHISAWGRFEQASHRWPDPKDTRIPRAGMDIIFWAPQILEDGVVKTAWHSLPSLNAYIKTRRTMGIKIGGRSVPRQNGHVGDEYGMLRTGDIVEITNDKTGMLAYRCEFYVGESAQRRREGEQIEMVEMPAIWDYHGSSLKTKTMH